MFGVEPADVTPAMRSKVKAMSYGLAYGLSAFGLSKQLHDLRWTRRRALMDEYFARFGGVRDYLRDVVDEARRTGYTETMLGPAPLPARPDQRQPAAARDGRADGAQRADPGLGRRHHQGRHAAASTRRCAEPGPRSRMLLQVHDELVLEVAPGEREAVEALVRREMGAAIEMDVPLDVSVGVGRSWQDAGH